MGRDFIVFIEVHCRCRRKRKILGRSRLWISNCICNRKTISSIFTMKFIKNDTIDAKWCNYPSWLNDWDYKKQLLYQIAVRKIACKSDCHDHLNLAWFWKRVKIVVKVTFSSYDIKVRKEFVFQCLIFVSNYAIVFCKRMD